MKRLLPALPRGLQLLPPQLLARGFAAAPGDAGGGAAPPAAKPASSGKKKGGKPAGPKMTQPKILYGHGAQDRPTRSEALAADRAKRAAAAGGGAGGAVHEADPVLAGLLASAGRALANPLDLERLVPMVGGIEEPSDVDVAVATHRFVGVPRFAEEYQGRVIAVPTRQDLDGLTDHEDDGPEEAQREEAWEEAQRALLRARASTARARLPAPLLPFLPRGPAGEASGRAAEMAHDLLRSDPGLARARAATAAATGEAGSSSSSSSSPQGYGAEGLLQDEHGDLLAPTEAMGLQDARLAAVLSNLTKGRRLVPSAEHRAMTEALWDEDNGEAGTTIAGPMGGDNVGDIPRGIIEEFATPYDFETPRGGSMRARDGVHSAPTLREATMTPSERRLNDRRKELRAIIEAPVPVATRPIWPLYSLIAGADIVRLVTGGGVIDSFRSMVVVGNGHGGIGVGMAKHRDAFHATRSALERAQRDMIHLAMHNGCLHHDLLGKKNGVHVLLRANPATGAVLKGAPAIVDVLELAGLKSASAKIYGSHRRSPYVVMQALFDAFNHHLSPEEEAAKRGLRLVRHTVDRVNPRTVYPFFSPGPRFPAANHRFVS